MLAGVVLSEAGMHEGLNVVQTQSYGPEARLGASKSEVVLSGSEIAFPEVEVPDLLLCLSIDSYTKYGDNLAADGIRLVEESVTLEKEVENAIILPILETAQDLGDLIVANMVAVGAIVSITGMVSKEKLLKAMESRVKSRYLDLNRKALEEGFKLGADHAVKQ